MNKPCLTCPFLEANRHKPTPTDFKCVEFNETEWYSEENIKGVWEHMRLRPMEFLSCHSSDPDYYGKDDRPVYACVGAATTIYVHIKVLELAGSYPQYVAIVGKENAIPHWVIAQKIMYFAAGVTSPEWGSMILPQKLHIDLSVMRWPQGFKKILRFLKKNLYGKEQAQTK
jgi:hypothetical protein